MCSLSSACYAVLMSTLNKFQQILPEGVEVILLGEYGSTAHGVALDASDHDYVGIGVEPKRMMLGMDYVGYNRWDNSVLKDNGMSSRSEAGSEEGTVHSLRKFFKLAYEGNTAILSTLYLPNYVHMSPIGEHLMANRDVFLSRRALWKFGGHLVHERDRMIGTKREKVLRPDLVEKYGYDTKAAYQAIKLAYHGLRYARESRLMIPFAPEEREFILAVRRGEVAHAEVVSFLNSALEVLNHEAENSTSLVDSADEQKINALLIELYELSYYDKSFA